jgi:hypothetical protein
MKDFFECLNSSKPAFGPLASQSDTPESLVTSASLDAFEKEVRKHTYRNPLGLKGLSQKDREFQDQVTQLVREFKEFLSHGGVARATNAE